MGYQFRDGRTFVGGAITSDIGSSGMKFSIVERGCRAVVGNTYVELGVVLGWWHDW